MPSNPVIFIDTSVLANLIEVPGRCDRALEIRTEFEKLLGEGARFVIPVTAIIETGNLVANASLPASAAAGKLASVIRAAKSEDPPWTIRDVRWNDGFLEDLLRGDSTGSDLEYHLGTRTLGSGDVAILVERDRFRRDTAFTDVRIWTLDRRLSAYS